MTRKFNFSKNKSEVLSNDIDRGVYFSQRRKLPEFKATIRQTMCFLFNHRVGSLLSK